MLKLGKDISGQLIQTMGSIVVGLDIKGDIVIFNKAAERITQYKKKEVVGRNWFKIFLPKNIKVNVKKVFNDLLSGKLPSEYENPIITKRGEKRIIHWHNTFLKDDKGKISLVLATGIDVTEEKKAERELLRLKEFNEEIIRTTPNGVVVIDSNGKILLANKSQMRIAGVDAPPQSMYGRNILTLSSVKRVGLDKYMREVLKTSKSLDLYAFDFKKTLGGKHVFVDVKFRPMRDKRILMLVNDVTEQEVARRKLEKAYRELKALDDLKTQFIHNASHELNTPITTLKLNLESLVPYCSGERGKEMFDIISRNVDRLHNNINDLLNLSAIESGKMKYSMVNLDLSGLLTEVIDSMAALAQIKGLEFKTKLEEIEIKADAVKLHMVLSNIIGNAIKFTEKGSINITLKRKGNFAVIKIKDTGIGMTKDELSSLFTRFYQADKGYSGLGLGLSIAAEIIRNHGGTIKAKSRGIGKGSTFILEFPIALLRNK